MTYTEPALVVLLLLGIWGTARSWRSAGRSHRPWLETIALVGICFLSMNAGAWILSRPLEMWYMQEPMPRESADAIVVLSGTVAPWHSTRPYTVAGPDTYRRVQHAAFLFRRWKQLPILVSGGESEGRPHSQTMRHVLEAEGVPPQMIWTEERSRNTHEAAIYSSAILRSHGVSRVVLIIEANGMLRAARSFEKIGIVVVPAPIRFNHLTAEFGDWWPSSAPMMLNGENIHELVGLAWYKLRGWI